MPELGLWQTLAEAGPYALITGFVLWRVDAKLVTVMERGALILLLVFQLAKQAGLDIKQEDEVLETLLKGGHR